MSESPAALTSLGTVGKLLWLLGSLFTYLCVGAVTSASLGGGCEGHRLGWDVRLDSEDPPAGVRSASPVGQGLCWALGCSGALHRAPRCQADSAQSRLTLRDPTDLPAGLVCPWDFPGKNTGVGCHFLLQRIFPTPCLLCLLHWQADSLPLAAPGKQSQRLIPNGKSPKRARGSGTCRLTASHQGEEVGLSEEGEHRTCVPGTPRSSPCPPSMPRTKSLEWQPSCGVSPSFSEQWAA